MGTPRKQVVWLIAVLIIPVIRVSCVVPPYTPAGHNENQNGDQIFNLVASYFAAGYRISMICAFLYFQHGIRKSVRQLKRICKNLGLHRRCPESPDQDITNAILIELNGSGSCCGYRAMWQRLKRDHHLHVKRETVRQFLKILDPEGVIVRKRHRLRRRMYRNKGPHYLVHIDGYDKLKPYGFAIHGAIDGFSRKILWLEIGPSNNNPKIVAKYFLDYIRQVKGVPHIIRADRGTENKVVELIQVALRYHDGDEHSAERSFLYGKSTRNQRIERWWASMRSGGINYWINFFKDMCLSGALDTSSVIEIECLRFCFTALLRTDLYRIAKLWNEHHIRPCLNSESPSGKPDEMYHLPLLFGGEDYKHEIDLTQLDPVEQEYCISVGVNGCSEETEAVAQAYMREHHIDMPQTCSDALILYGHLLELFNDMIN